MTTVIEVFIFDLAGITALWRALSFVGLGIALIGIGLAHSTCCSAHAHVPRRLPSRRRCDRVTEASARRRKC
jgi:uncharacterized membrane protein